MHDRGPARTGVTVILPHGGDLYRLKTRAAVQTINGHGKAFGFEQVCELGLLEFPIALTNTLNVGLVADALIHWSIQRDPEIGRDGSLTVLVGETNDGYLNDLQGRHVRCEHMQAALAAALDPSGTASVEEGSIGAWKRLASDGRGASAPPAGSSLPIAETMSSAPSCSPTSAAEELTLLGVPVGRQLAPGVIQSATPERGSIMIILATDAPLSERQLGRLSIRAGVGLARVGGMFGHGSGDFVIAFSTANPVAHEPTALAVSQLVMVDEEHAMRGPFPATIEAVEDAGLDSLFTARTITGREGRVRHALHGGGAPCSNS